MKFNKPLLAVLLSIIGGIPASIFTQIMIWLHLTSITAPEAASLMFLKQSSMALGILAHIGYSSVLGLVIYYSAIVLGTDYFPLKAMIISMVAESLLFIIFVSGSPQSQGVSGNFVHAGAAAIAGLSRGYLIKRFIFNKLVNT
jgi:hypothetical protein